MAGGRPHPQLFQRHRELPPSPLRRATSQEVNSLARKPFYRQFIRFSFIRFDGVRRSQPSSELKQVLGEKQNIFIETTLRTLPPSKTR